MYVYDQYDQKIVEYRVKQFRDQTRRYLSRIGRIGGQAGQGERKRTRAKLTEADAQAIRKLDGEGRDVNWLAARYGVTPETVRRVLRGETWRIV